MTKEQRTSLNILIDLAIRKGIDFDFRSEDGAIWFYGKLQVFCIYKFKGAKQNAIDFKETQQALNNL